jgi:hypothetical protein
MLVAVQVHLEVLQIRFPVERAVVDRRLLP